MLCFGFKYKFFRMFNKTLFVVFSSFGKFDETYEKKSARRLLTFREMLFTDKSLASID